MMEDAVMPPGIVSAGYRSDYISGVLRLVIEKTSLEHVAGALWDYLETRYGEEAFKYSGRPSDWHEAATIAHKLVIHARKESM